MNDRPVAQHDDPRTGASAWAIRAAGVVKTFGPIRAVDGLDLAVPRGGVFGLLGPNGAGKTTTIRLFATLSRPDAGSVSVLGHDVVAEPDAVRRRIALTGQFATMDDSLTGVENLVLQARLLGLSRRAAARRAAELVDAFDLSAAAGRAVKTYSGGMLRRLDLAASVTIAPDLLFLDEPTVGLDPHSRNEVWRMVRVLVREGTTVLLTTQYLDEADRLADRVAVIDHGRIVAEGTPGQLKSTVGSGVLRVRLAAPDQRERARRVLVAELGTPVREESDPMALTARIDARDDAAAGLVAEALISLSNEAFAVTGFSLGQPSLDEVFLALTGHAADETDSQEVTS